MGAVTSCLEVREVYNKEDPEEEIENGLQWVSIASLTVYPTTKSITAVVEARIKGCDKILDKMENSSSSLKETELENVERIFQLEDNFSKSLIFAVPSSYTLRASNESSGLTIHKTDFNVNIITPSVKDQKLYGEYSHKNKLQNLRINLIQDRLKQQGKLSPNEVILANQNSALIQTNLTRSIYSGSPNQTNRLDDTTLDELEVGQFPVEVLKQTEHALKLEEQEMSRKIDALGEKISEQVKLIKQYLQDDPPLDIELLKTLQKTSEYAKQSAELAKQIKFNMGLETEETKHLLTKNQSYFHQSVKSSARLFKLAADAGNESQLVSNQGTPFFSKCRATGCTNPEMHAWYHPCGKQLNSYDTHLSYYLMIYPDNTGRIMCTFCKHNPGPQHIDYWEFACDQHKEIYSYRG